MTFLAKKNLFVLNLTIFIALPASGYAQTPVDYVEGKTKEIVEGYVNDKLMNLQSNAVTNIQSELKNYFPTVVIDMQMKQDFKPRFGMLIVAPITDPSDVKNTFFTQDSVYYRDGRTTVNLGLGYRRLEMNNTLLLGVNTFYDHEFPYDHGRVSLGLEARTSVFEVNANQYWATKDWLKGEGGGLERAVNGYDIEAGVPLPYMNWAVISLKQFDWSRGDNTIENGKEVALTARIPPLPGLIIEMGRTYFTGKDWDDRNYVNISYDFSSYTSQKGKNFPSWFSERAYTLRSMETMRFERVMRRNEIVKEFDAGGTFNIKGV